MRRFSSKQNLQALAELNVTPLIDLAFTLLIIFMITTPLIENRLDLIVPTSESAKTAVDIKDVNLISIDRAGIINLNEQPISAEALTAELSNLLHINPNTAVVVRADRSLSVQVLISLMDAIKEAGITKIGIMAKLDES